MGRRGHSFVAGNHKKKHVLSLLLFSSLLLLLLSTLPCIQPYIRFTFTSSIRLFWFPSRVLLYSYFHLPGHQPQPLFQRLSSCLCLCRLVSSWLPTILSTTSQRSWHYVKIRKLLAIGLVMPRNVSIALLDSCWSLRYSGARSNQVP